NGAAARTFGAASAPTPDPVASNGTEPADARPAPKAMPATATEKITKRDLVVIASSCELVASRQGSGAGKTGASRPPNVQEKKRPWRINKVGHAACPLRGTAECDFVALVGEISSHRQALRVALEQKGAGADPVLASSRTLPCNARSSVSRTTSAVEGARPCDRA